MTRRLAATTSLVVFAMCLFLGLRAENSFGTTVLRALLAMVVTFVVGTIIGAMAEKMISESLTQTEKKENSVK